MSATTEGLQSTGHNLAHSESQSLEVHCSLAGSVKTEVSRIISDNGNEDREQCYEMFVRWRAVSPESYTYPVLGEALRRESQEVFNEFVKKVYRVETNIDLSSDD